jgi:hypothetical protein
LTNGLKNTTGDALRLGFYRQRSSSSFVSPSLYAVSNLKKPILQNQVFPAPSFCLVSHPSCFLFVAYVYLTDLLITMSNAALHYLNYSPQSLLFAALNQCP